MRCKHCRFWHEDKHDVGMGVCRRRAPEPQRYIIGGGEDENTYVPIWPETGARDFCGELDPRPEGNGQKEAKAT